ncbi:MAG: tetratricopeptide repeat protein, partial [Proteobacteria bacterium]|nr:tetratricopeptide repeat protein [Pseudomonadota bacterium]
FPQTRERLFRLMRGSEGGGKWPPLGSWLINTILYFAPRRIPIVLDDFHEINKDEGIREVVQYLLKHAPPNLHIVLLSRTKPNLALSKLRTAGEILEISPDELGFSLREIAVLFKNLYGVELADRELDSLHQYTDGWVMSLRMVAEAMSAKAPQDVSGSLIALQETHDTVVQYFDEEVVDRLPQDVRSFLVRSSILERFDASLCDYVLEKTNSRDIIDDILKRELFLIRLDENGEWYRYHNLFRDSLTARLESESGRETANNLHRRAAAYYRERRDWQKAAHHNIAAADFEAAADSIESVVREDFGHPALGALQDWLNRLPEEIVENRSALLFGNGWIRNARGDYQTAADFMIRAKDKAVSEKNARILGRAVRFLMDIHAVIRNYAQVEKLYRDNFELLEKNSTQASRCMVIMAGTYMSLNRPNEARELWEELNVKVTAPKSDFDWAAPNAMGYTYYFPLGRFEEAIRHTEAAIKSNREKSYLNLYCLNVVHLAMIKHEMGRFDESEKRLEELADVLQSVGNRHILNAAYSCRAINAIHLNRPDLARKILENVEDSVFETVSQYLADCARAMLAHRDGDPGTTQNLAGRIMESVEKANAHAQIWTVSCWLAPLYADLGDHAAAEKMLEKALSLAEKMGAAYARARCHLLLASVCFDRGREDATAAHLEKSFDIAEKENYDFLFTAKEKGPALKLLPFALEKKLNLPFVTRLLAKQGKRIAGMILPFLESDDAELRVSAVEILTSMKFRDAEKEIAKLAKDPVDEVRETATICLIRIKSFPPLPLKVQTLGRFRLFKNTREIPAKAWRLKTAKSLFKYLLFNREKEISTDVLVETFYKGVSLDDAKARLHKVASSLRAALEPGIAPKRESAYLGSRDGYYQLVLPEESSVDAFEFEILCGKAGIARERGELRQALSLYKSALELYQGDLLEEDLYEDWTNPLRRRFNELYLKASKSISRYYFQLFEYDLAIEFLSDLLEKESWDEDAWLLLMRCHLAKGDKPRAVKTYQRCRKILGEELDLEPGQTLNDLFQSIR